MSEAVTATHLIQSFMLYAVKGFDGRLHSGESIQVTFVLLLDEVDVVHDTLSSSRDPRGLIRSSQGSVEWAGESAAPSRSHISRGTSLSLSLSQL